MSIVKIDTDDLRKIIHDEVKKALNEIFNEKNYWNQMEIFADNLTQVSLEEQKEIEAELGSTPPERKPVKSKSLEF